jgi:Holliday junction resolvase
MSGGAGSRRKGDRIERELVALHEGIGVHCERYPLSGASHFRGAGHDLDVYALGREHAPLVAEAKGRKNGAGFTTLERWLGDFDALFLRRDRADPLVVLPWRVWARLLEKVRR